MVGRTEMKYRNQSFTLLPVSHTTQNAHVEVVIDEDGDFLSSTIISKEDTLIPATEESASRAGSKIAPYPLHDKLLYVAGDYEKYGGSIKKQKDEPFVTYINNLKEWVHSPYGNQRVQLIYHYLSKGTLIKDLIEDGTLVVDDGILIEKWNRDYEKKFNGKPEIFNSGATDQYSVFVRFTTYSSTGLEIWKDKEVFDSFSKYYEDKLRKEKNWTCVM